MKPAWPAVAAEYGVTQLAGVTCNAQGTPLVSSIFAEARRASDSPLLTYVNADILLLPDFLAAARDVSRQANEFLVIGQRWDLDVAELLDFSPGWEKRLEQDADRARQAARPGRQRLLPLPAPPLHRYSRFRHRARRLG